MAVGGLFGARRQRGAQERAESRLGLLMAAPAIVTILLIAVIPLTQTIQDSLFQISLKFENAPRPFVGLDNYVSVLGDESWFNALRVTGVVAAASVAAELVLGMIIALLINRSFRGRGVVRAAVLVPWALTTVVSAKMWAWIYDGRYGIVNDVLMKLHVIDQPIIFLVRPELTIWAMIAAEIWKTTPFMALLLLAGLQLIPHELHEASALDGASRWQAFWRVTLPLLKPTILVALLFRTIDAVRMFDLPRVLTNGGPGKSTETVVLYTYNTFFTALNFGYGSTLAVVIFLIVLLVCFIYIKGARRADSGSTAMTAPANAVSVHARSNAAASRRTRVKVFEGFGFYTFVAGFVVFCLAPFVWTFLTALKGPTTIFEVPIRYLPSPPDLINYRDIFGLERFRWALLNSTIVASSATAISLVIGSLCAYAIARLNFPFKNLLLALVLAIAMFPGIAIIGPLFRQFNAWGLTNNYMALILPNVTFTLPICIWTLTAFFSDLPSELEESARVDGCTRMQAFYKITVPLAAPGVFTAAILLFIQAWNEFLFARTFMSQPNRLTATVAIAQFEGADIAAQYPWGQITAASIVITLPLVVLVLLFQRRIISGLTAGAVKG